MVWRGRLLSHLVQRLRVLDALARHPEIERAARAGARLHGRPAAHRHHRALAPARAGSRHALAARLGVRAAGAAARDGDASTTTRASRPAAKQLEAMHQLSPRLAAMHEDTPTGPTENHDLLGMSFRTFHFEGMAFVPRYVAWWLACDMVPAYRLMKRTLQLLAVALPARPAGSSSRRPTRSSSTPCSRCSRTRAS